MVGHLPLKQKILGSSPSPAAKDDRLILIKVYKLFSNKSYD